MARNQPWFSAGILVAVLTGCTQEKSAPIVTTAPTPSLAPAQPPESSGAESTLAESKVTPAESTDTLPSVSDELPSEAKSEDTPEEPGPGIASDSKDTPQQEPSEEQKSASSATSRKELLKTAGRGVVLITTYDALGEKAGFGSGCLVGQGLVLTNYHVIESAVTAKVQPQGTGDDRLGAEVDVLGYRVLDANHDLALLQVEGLPAGLHILPIAGPAGLEQFDAVFAIGHPDGLKFSTSPGFVNALLKTSDLPEQFQTIIRSQDTEWIQTDAIIAGGSSGGPLLNELGEVVGINTIRLTNRSGLAVAARHVRDLMAKEQSAVSQLPVPHADVLVTKAVAEIRREYVREMQQFQVDIERVAREGDGFELQRWIRCNHPGPACVMACREIIKQRTGPTETADAIRLTTSVLAANEGRSVPGRQYLDQLLDEASQDASMIPPKADIIAALHGVPYSMELERYLRSVIEGSADNDTKGAAGVVLVSSMLSAVGDGLEAEMGELARKISDAYGDVQFQSATVKEALKPILDQQQFAIGQIAPEIQGVDSDGKEFRLSDYRGKVVVLDFWADWCPHCRNMYPHERRMVENLKDKTFALLGVNGDEPKRAKRVISAGTVTWRTWMDGPGGPIAEKYQVSSWPTVLVLAPDGRIQFKDVRDEELEAAVLSMLDEAPTGAADQLIPPDSEWRFQPGVALTDLSAWRQPEFDDSDWSVGKAPLGFGPINLATHVPPVHDQEFPLTLLFRRTFDAPAEGRPEKLLLRLRYQDGIAIYLNGLEVHRDQLTAAAGLDQPALSRDDNSELPGIGIAIDSRLLKETGNCLAVEVHRSSIHRATSIFQAFLARLWPFLVG